MGVSAIVVERVDETGNDRRVYHTRRRAKRKHRALPITAARSPARRPPGGASGGASEGAPDPDAGRRPTGPIGPGIFNGAPRTRPPAETHIPDPRKAIKHI
jgi:hypothetical protein